jgi:cytoskeletal protein CcmA (bactofilin family)
MTRTKTTAIEATLPTAPATSTPEKSRIAQNATFEGRIRAAAGVDVFGTIRGGIEAVESVHIGRDALVEADVTALEVVVAGTYQGNLTCHDYVNITPTGCA